MPRSLSLSRAAVRQLGLPRNQPESPRGGPNGAPAGPGPIVLTLPLPENRQRGNRGHWWQVSRARKRYEDACAIRLALGLLPEPPARPFRKCYVTAVIRCWSAMDEGNALSRLKWTEDFLVRSGYIANDSRRHLRWRAVPEQVVDRKQPASVQITLTPVEEWA